jgi:hypothetical protein
VAAEAEIAAIVVVVVVGEEWADAVEDGAVVVRRHERRCHGLLFTRTIHQDDTRFATTVFSLWEHKGWHIFL